MSGGLPRRPKPGGRPPRRPTTETRLDNGKSMIADSGSCVYCTSIRSSVIILLFNTSNRRYRSHHCCDFHFFTTGKAVPVPHGPRHHECHSRVQLLLHGSSLCSYRRARAPAALAMPVCILYCSPLVHSNCQCHGFKQIIGSQPIHFNCNVSAILQFVALEPYRHC